MPDDRNPKNGRQRQPGAAADAARMMDDSIRQAFLTHMSEQQRQFAVMPITVRRASDRDPMKKARQQEHTGGHDKPEPQARGLAGARGAETVEMKRR